MLSGDSLAVVASAGSLSGATGQSLVSGRLECRAAIAERRVIIFSGLESDSHDESDHPQPGNRRFLVAPLVAGGGVVGVVMAMNPRGRAFHQIDVARAARLTELVAMAVHNSLLLAQQALVAIEAAQLYRSATQAERRAEVLSLVGRAHAHATDAPTFFEELLRVAHKALGASGLTVYSIDHTSTEISVAYTADVAANQLTRVIPRALTPAEVVSGIVNGVEAFCEDILSDGATHIWKSVSGENELEGVVSLARLPLVVEGRVRGALTLRWESRKSFPPKECSFLQDFAGHVAIALGKSQQLEAERRSREIAEAAAAIARGALETSDAGRTATLALGAIERAVPSLGRAIAFMDGSGTTLRYFAASGSLAELNGRKIPMAESAAALTVRTLDHASVDRIREGPVVPVGCTVIPLVDKERTIGVLLSVAPATLVEGADFETLQNLAASLALAADVLLLNEKELSRRARETMLATALATMDQAVLIIGLDRRVLYANAAATKEYGYAFDSSPSIAFERLVDSASVAHRLGAGATETGGTWEAEHMHRRRDGSLFPASVLLSYIRDGGHFPVGQVVTIRNLTDERRIEDKLRQSEKLAALGELVAGVAHELNNPLAGISTFAQLLLEDDLADEQHESVRLIKREADRAVGVIRDLLVFSRKSGPTQSHVDINEMVELTLRLRGYALRSAGIDVRLELAPSLPTVPGDSQRLQQVLLNLIINAEYALHRAESKRLVVRSERTRDGVCLIVSDTGAGMDEETRQRIFEPFFTTKPAGEGTGLGLSVSYGIVRAHGGLIDVQSGPGAGTIFRIELPLQSATNVAAEA